MNEEHDFFTSPLPGANSYPSKVAVIGDLGITHFSSTTYDHLVQNDPNLVLLIGDVVYANNYITTGDKVAACYECDFSNTPMRRTYQTSMGSLGKVHAYERTNRVYNYELNQCGPVYITVGDGGNSERVVIKHADQPGSCPKKVHVPDIGGTCTYIFPNGPAKGKIYWDMQPEWSAFRESSFGHGILEVSVVAHGWGKCCIAKCSSIHVIEHNKIICSASFDNYAVQLVCPRILQEFEQLQCRFHQVLYVLVML